VVIINALLGKLTIEKKKIMRIFGEISGLSILIADISDSRDSSGPIRVAKTG
jgi:hypothetical protein